MKALNCPFCGTDALAVYDNAEMEWRSIEKRVLCATKNVVLCAGLGAIVQPYVLAFTREHHIALSELDETCRRDLFNILDSCLASGLFPSGSLCVFEHGGKNSANPIACLEHCHLHIIDGAFNLTQDFILDFPEAMATVLSETIGLSDQPGYLFTGIYEGARAITGRLIRTPACGSQYFRKLLAVQVDSSDWNWRLSPKPDIAQQLCERWPEH